MSEQEQQAGAGPVEQPVRPLAWTEELGPEPGCPYNHIAAKTLFGQFLITWKGWKESDWPCIDETPWGEFFGSWPNVEAAKAACEEEFARRVIECLSPKNEWDGSCVLGHCSSPGGCERDESCRAK